MFVKDSDGDFVNLDTGLIITNRSTSVDAIMPGEYEAISSLYIGSNGDGYMAELEKELAAFGKLIRVEIPEEKPQLSGLARSNECTCGLGEEWEHGPDHKVGCPFYAPF